MEKQRKVVIIGAGHVGSHCAYALVSRRLCHELVLVDTNQALAEAQALDIADGAQYLEPNTLVKAGDLSDCSNADLVVLSAGKPRLPGQTRLDLLADSRQLVEEVVPAVVKSGFSGIFLVLTNPVDLVAYDVLKISGFPKNRVIGSGTALDSARLRRILSTYTGIHSSSIEAMSMGEHGDSQMVPWSKVRVGGEDFLSLWEKSGGWGSGKTLEDLTGEVRQAGMVVIDGKGCTEFGIGSTVARLAAALFFDEHCVLPVSAFLGGEYGQQNLYAGVPCVIGEEGVLSIVEWTLPLKEQKEFANSCQVILQYLG